MSQEWVFIGIQVVLLAIGYEFIRRNPVHRSILAQEALDTLEAIHYLREDEGDALVLFCDNPDFIGPDCAIDCNGWWTHGCDRRFSGRTLLECLQQAVAAKRAVAERAAALRGINDPTAVVAQ